MSTHLLVRERIEGYTAELKGFTDSDVTSMESFNALKESVESFIIGLSTFQILGHSKDIQGLQSGLASQAERFADVGSPKRPSGIPNETKFWPPQELKELHRRVEDLEASPSEHSAEEAKQIAQEVQEFQSTHTLSTVLSSSGVIGELNERVTALQTPPRQDTEESHVIETPVDMDEVVEDGEVEQGSSFWKKAGALALIGLVLFAPAAAILAPMLMSSSNSQNATDTSFDMPRGGTQTDFSSNPISMPDLQALNPANHTPSGSAPTIIEPPVVYANNTLPPVDITTLQPTSNPVSFEPPVSYANSTMAPADITTLQPVTTPTGMTPHTPIADSTYQPEVRYVDRATLRGDEMVPDGVTVIEYDSRVPTGLELPSSAETVVGSTIPAITDGKEATTPVFDPLTLFNNDRTAQFSMPTSSKVHNTGLLRLPAPPADTQKSVTTPPSINTVASLDPRARLTLPLSVPSLDLRDVCAANHTNSTITT